MEGDELNVSEDSLKDVVEAYFARASREDVLELLAEARSRLTDDAIAMWEGDDSDFFPLPDHDIIEGCVSAGLAVMEFAHPVKFEDLKSNDRTLVVSGSSLEDEDFSEKMTLAA